jgi:dienelactone hydrolase
MLLSQSLFAGPREDFLKLIDQPRVPLNVSIDTAKEADGIVTHPFAFDATTGQRVPGYLLKKAGSTGKHPVVIALHGTGGTKNSELAIAKTLAEKGFVAVTIDGRYHGDRAKPPLGKESYQDAILRAFREQKEHPFFYDTVFDVMRLVDYLQTRDDVDSSRIGLYGVSKGGIETYLTAAVDPRITAAVPCIGVESFNYAIENDDLWKERTGTIANAFASAAKEARVENPDKAFVKTFYDRVSPKIYSEFDGPSMLPLIAPRALMTINGELDKRTPPVGLKMCTDAAEAAYKSAGASDKFKVVIEPNTGHKVNPEAQVAAVDWFVQHLKP